MNGNMPWKAGQQETFCFLSCTGQDFRSYFSKWIIIPWSRKTNKKSSSIDFLGQAFFDVALTSLTWSCSWLGKGFHWNCGNFLARFHSHLHYNWRFWLLWAHHHRLHAWTWQPDIQGFPFPTLKWRNIFIVLPYSFQFSAISLEFLKFRCCGGKIWWNIIDRGICCWAVEAVEPSIRSWAVYVVSEEWKIIPVTM